MCICVHENPVLCKAKRYGYSVDDDPIEPCKCTCHIVGVDIASGEDKTVTMVVECCSFFGCAELVCEADKESPDRMHFCQKHHDQLAQYVKENAIPKIIGFWVKANGGAKKLASTF